MSLVRNIKLKMDMENYLLQHKIVALKIATKNIDPTRMARKIHRSCHIYFISYGRGKKRLAVDIYNGPRLEV